MIHDGNICVRHDKIFYFRLFVFFPARYLNLTPSSAIRPVYALMYICKLTPIVVYDGNLRQSGLSSATSVFFPDIVPAMSPNNQEVSNTEDTLPSTVISTAGRHLCDILTLAFNHDDSHAAVVVFDTRCELSRALTAAYRLALPKASFIDFDTSTPEAVLAMLAPLVASDLVVLIQSTNFRMDAFRIRVELFKRELKVIEHPHLGRMPGEQVLFYIDALAYDPAYYRGVGNALKQKIDAANGGVVDSGNGARLVFASPFESAKLNVGDYSEMKNVGGQFPIGEVFTEAKDLEAVSGQVRIFIFGDTTFSVNRPDQPITLVVEKGQVVDALDSTPEFDQVLANIRADEGGVVWLRELGFGMNRAFTKDRTVNDIGTYERMCGIHLSLGAKHGIYGKPNFKRGDGKHHVDVFAVTDAVLLNDEVVYRDGNWVV
jgi:aminopeptidase